DPERPQKRGGILEILIPCSHTLGADCPNLARHETRSSRLCELLKQPRFPGETPAAAPKPDAHRRGEPRFEPGPPGASCKTAIRLKQSRAQCASPLDRHGRER